MTLNDRGLGAALIAVVGLVAALFAFVGTQLQPLKSRYGEVILWFPSNPNLGPHRDAWVEYIVREHNGIKYRYFLSTNIYFGKFAHFGFPSDGSSPYNFFTSCYENGVYCGAYPCLFWANGHLLIHRAVAFLFGAPKRTGYPMSLLLVVDHIVEGNGANFSLDNLQFLSPRQNAFKASNIKEVAKNKGAKLLPLGDDAGNGWYGELRPLYEFPENPTLGPGGDAWTEYLERQHNGKSYRSFLSTNRLYGFLSKYGFPFDGSAPYNFKSGHFLEKNTRNGYRAITVGMQGNYGDTTGKFSIHIAVAYLFGARKISGYPMTSLLVVDHINNDKKNFSLANLQIASGMQNCHKYNKVVEEAEEEDVSDGSCAVAAVCMVLLAFVLLLLFPLPLQ